MSDYCILSSDGELYHYGVKGQKWGVRRYQNKDGSLTSAGKKKARQEYRSDNKMAFELGKNATISGHAAARSMNRTVRLENKLEKQYEKDPGGSVSRTQKLNKKWQASAKTTAQLVETYTKQKNAAEKHCKSLIDKYGREAVSSIKYKNIGITKGRHSPSNFKTMNESTTTWSERALSIGATMASIGLTMMGACPVYAIIRPLTTGEKARDVERATYRDNLKSQK